MRTSLRVFAAGLSTLIAAAFLIVVPSASPAHAIEQLHSINLSANDADEGSPVTLTASINFSPVPGETITATIKTQDLTAFDGVGDPAASDYTPVTSHQFSWTFGSPLQQTFDITTVQDTTPEPQEQFSILFVSTSGASAGTTATGTIHQSDVDGAHPVPVITVSTVAGASGPETDSPRIARLHLDRIYNQDISINYATQDGSAIAPGDYTAASGTKIWPAADVDPTDNDLDIAIPIVDDAFGEPTEQFKFIVGQNSNAALTANPNQTFTITNAGDPAPPQLAVAPITPVTEGDSGTKVITVTVTVTPPVNQPITVDYETADGSAVASTQDAKGDYEPVVKTKMTIGPGQGSKTFDVTINGDLAQEPDEVFSATISNANNAEIATPSQNGTIQNDDFGQITTGPGPGGGPDVETFGAGGARLFGFYAYEAAFTGGVHVARGDFFKADGTPGADGIDEIVVGPGQKSRPLVRVFAPDGTIRASFLAFAEGFPGGVYVAPGNFDGDPSNGDELVVSAGPGGGPHVRVLRVQGGANILDLSNGGFFAYGSGFSGGVRVAAGNMQGDSKDEIITAPGAGGGPHVRVWGLDASNSFEPKSEFMAYAPNFTGGVFVAAKAGAIVTGAGAGGGPHVRLFAADGTPSGGGFFAYDPNFHGGVSVAMGNLDNDPAPEIVTGPGAGGGPHIRAFKLDGSTPFGGGFFAYQNFTGGVEVAVGNGG